MPTKLRLAYKRRGEPSLVISFSPVVRAFPEVRPAQATNGFLQTHTTRLTTLRLQLGHKVSHVVSEVARDAPKATHAPMQADGHARSTQRPWLLRSGRLHPLARMRLLERRRQRLRRPRLLQH